MIDLLFKNKNDSQRWQVSFEHSYFPSQCGINIIYALEFYNINNGTQQGKYLKNYKKEWKDIFNIFYDFISTGNMENIVKTSTRYAKYNPFYNDYGSPRCARVILSDVVDNKGPHMTSAFAEAMELDSAGILLNPNSHNNIDMWWIDLPEIDPETM